MTVLLAGSALQPASAQAVGSRPGHHRRRETWAQPGASLRTAPRRLVAQAPARRHAPVRITSIRNVGGHPRVVVTTRRTAATARAAIAAAQQAPGVVAVAVDTKVHTEVTPSNDTDRWAQWALDRLDAEALWADQSGNGVVVAVVDTGVDAAHPDLRGVVLPGTDFVAAGGDGSADGNGHGTHVAGIIAAVANNHQGVAGLAQGVQILPVRVLDDSGAGWSSSIAQGIIWATDHGASVINLSLGGPGPDDVTAAAVQYAEDHGVVVVAAAGNDRANGDPTTYPAAYPGVLGVAASDSADHLASFSNTGSYVDLTAPGVQIASTFPPANYVYLSGTSMATPFVSSAAALLKAADPQLGPEQAAQTLESTAFDLGPAGRDDDSGYGLVEPAAALCSLTGCPSNVPTSAPVATVTRLSSGARMVRYGRVARGRITVADQATGRGLGNVPVELCTVAPAGTNPRCRPFTTGPTGGLRFQLRIRHDVEVYAVHPGTDTSRASRSPRIRYRVAPLVHVYVWRHRITATVRPADGQLLRLQRWTGQRWVRAGRVRVDVHGRAVFRHLPRGRLRVRLPSRAVGGGAVIHVPRDR